MWHNRLSSVAIMIWLVFAFGFSGTVQAVEWTTLDVPGATGTTAYGIDSNNIICGSSLGFSIYNITTATWTTNFDLPGVPSGISGDYIAGNGGGGTWGVNGGGPFYAFLYNTTTAQWIPLNMPGEACTEVGCISGDNVVGYYCGGGAFFYNITTATWTPYNDVPAYPSGFSGNNIVGTWYVDYVGYQGFVYNMLTGTTTTLVAPASDNGTDAKGISGDNVVGFCEYAANWSGFLYNIPTAAWTTFNVPGSTITFAYGISGNNIVGSYADALGNTHGFICKMPTVPEMVSSVNSISNVSVAYGTTLADTQSQLPTTVDVTLDDSTIVSATVTWNGGSPAYDGTTVGTYVFTGTLAPLLGVTNPGNLTASVNVSVMFPGNVHIQITGMPKYGKSGNARGTVTGISKSEVNNCRVLVYINVEGNWWTKPTIKSFATKIGKNMKWTADITTSRTDKDATEIRAYIVPKGFSALCESSHTLPASLDPYPFADVSR